MINIDFETRSAVDLLTEGVYNYAMDPSTEVICMAYSVDGQEPELWLPGDPVPECFGLGYKHGAWNSTFERLMWDYIMVPDHGFGERRIEDWLCTAFMARCNNVPNALGNAARCLRIDAQKDKRGAELIKLLSLPMADGTFCNDPDLLQEFYDYCLQDVRAEMGVRAMLREPSDEEWADFFANERINDRGIRIDRPLAIAAQAYAAEEEADLLEQIAEVTDGQVTKARGEKLKEFVLPLLTEEQEKATVKYRNGERKISFDKYNRERLLSFDDLDPVARIVVESSDMAQKSSVGKYRAMERLADPEDDRVRGALMCNGASESGRFSSKGLQLHNFPREVHKKPEEVRADLVDNIMAEDMVDYFGMPVMTILSRQLRAALIPAPGNVFLVSDWSAIEGRVAPWLCDNDQGEAKLDLYRTADACEDAKEEGKDVYTITAARTFKVEPTEVTGDQRQVGKVQELAFQYQGGKGAWAAMARNYGLHSTPAEAERYKDAWRRTNPWATSIWSDIERAAMLAVKRSGHRYNAGRLSYFSVKDVLCGGVTLFCELPCGRLLTYPDARIEAVDGPYGMRDQLTVLRAAWVPKANEKEWPRTAVYGGKLFNNAVQGTAASLMRHAVREADDAQLPVVFHVHDELVVESSDAENDAERLRRIMNTPPEWAAGLPLQAPVDVMERFGK